MNQNKIQITTECLEDLLQWSNFKIKITGVEQDPVTNVITFHTEGSPFSSEYITMNYTKVPSEWKTELTEIRARK